MYTSNHALDERMKSQQRWFLLSPNSLISIAGALCERALICELNMANLIVIVFSGKCQLSFTVLHWDRCHLCMCMLEVLGGQWSLYLTCICWPVTCTWLGGSHFGDILVTSHSCSTLYKTGRFLVDIICPVHQKRCSLHYPLCSLHYAERHGNVLTNFGSCHSCGRRCPWVLFRPTHLWPISTITRPI